MRRINTMETRYKRQEAQMLEGDTESVRARLDTMLRQGWRIVPESALPEGHRLTIGVYLMGMQIEELEAAA